jgi:branched-chain amino acid transport system permease protein
MKKIPIVILVLLLVVWPFIGPEYQVYLTLSVFAYSVALLGLNLLFNYTGLLSFGHAMFVGIGGYSAAFLTSRFQIQYMEVSLLVAILISGLVSFIIGLVCVRYTKIYFAMLTLAFGMLFYSFLMKSYFLTGGDEGMGVEQPFLLGINYSSMGQMDFFLGPYYYYSLCVLVLAGILMWRIVHSPFGVCLMSIRDNPDKAESLGIGIKRYRLYAFIISGCFAGVGGVLLAPVTGHMDPAIVYWTQSGDLVFMTLLGGFSNFFGPILGSVIFIYLRDLLSSFTRNWRLIFGAILAAIVILAPGGVMEVFSRSANLLSNLLKGEARRKEAER